MNRNDVHETGVDVSVYTSQKVQPSKTPGEREEGGGGRMGMRMGGEGGSRMGVWIGGAD